MTAFREYVRSILEYDPETGVFKWLVSRGGACAGTVAGCQRSYCGGKLQYIAICIDGKLYNAHRLAFLYMTGRWPQAEIDHKDSDGLNNRWNNLREATTSQNQANRRITKRGVKGVSLNKARGKYIAYITVNQERIHLGSFESREDAFAAYKLAAQKYFGEFARTV